MNILKSSLVALAVVLSGNHSTYASIQVAAGDYVRVTDSLGGNGGVFEAQEVTGIGGSPVADSNSFFTFCVEVTETITLPGDYYVQAISSSASQSGNVLTDLARTIYSRFLGKALPAGAPTDEARYHNTVQMAIWREVTGLPVETLAGYIDFSGYDEPYLNELLGLEPLTGLGVSIMNLRGSSALNASYNQDLLIPLPPGSAEVPEAASILVWGVLISSVVAVANWRLQY